MKVVVVILMILSLAAVGWFIMDSWTPSLGQADPSVLGVTPAPPPAPETLPGAEGTSPGLAALQDTAPDVSISTTPSTPQSSSDVAAGSGQGQNAEPDFDSEHEPGTDWQADSEAGLYLDNDPEAQMSDPALDDKRNIMLMQAENLYLEGSYQEALELLLSDNSLLNNDTARLESEIRAAMG